MIKSKGILTISIISLFAVESAYAAIASSGYVDQQVGTKISEVNATTVANDETANVVTSISADGNTVTATKGITAEETANKVTTIRTDGTATDVAYPSEKAVATALDAKQDKLEGEVLTNTATGSGSVSTGGATATSATSSIALGNAANASTGAAVAVGVSSGASAKMATALGTAARAEGQSSLAVGGQSQATKPGSTAVGASTSSTGTGAVALGGTAKSQADYAIQLGAGTNSEANTLSVGLSDSNNYKLLGSDGKIPAERLPFEGDVLTNTATGSGSVSTGGADPVSAEKAVGLGYLANGSGTGVVAIGRETLASGVNSVGIGSWAEASGPAAISIGDSSAATKNSSIAIGNGALASGESSIAIGDAAVTYGDRSIQLGYGSNNEANTLSVGLSTTNNYKLLGSDGKIPAERLPFEGDVLTNTATGTDSFSTGGANVTTGSSSLAIGVDAATGLSGEVAVGAAAMSGGYASVAVGNAADATGGNAVAVGQNSLAGSMNSTAVGQGAKSTATYAIQLGAGTNSEAGTLSVGLRNGNYKLLGSNGKIPAERLPAATASTLGGVKSGGDVSISSTGAVSVVSSLKAVQDANGANIAATYATKDSVEDLQANKVKVDWTTSNVNKVLVIGSDDNYPDVLGKVTVARITENFLDDAIQNKLDTAVTNVTSSGTGSVIAGFSKSGNTMTVTRTNVQIPVGSATATSYASIWVE